MAVVVWVVLLDFDDRLVRRSAPRRRLLESIELFLLRAFPLQEYEAYVKEEANLRFRFCLIALLSSAMYWRLKQGAHCK